MRLALHVPVLLVLMTRAGGAVADEPAPPRAGEAPTAGAADISPRRSARTAEASAVHDGAPEEQLDEDAAPGERPKPPSRAGPIVLISVGGAVATMATGVLLLEAAGSSMGERRPDDPGPNLAVPAVVACLGLAVVIGGMVWLGKVNDEKRAMRRAAWATAIPVPAYDPSTRTVGLAVSSRF